jgi:hypothetical protein
MLLRPASFYPAPDFTFSPALSVFALSALIRKGKISVNISKNARNGVSTLLTHRLSTSTLRLAGDAFIDGSGLWMRQLTQL